MQLTKYKYAVEILFYSFVNSERNGEEIASLLNGIRRLDFLHKHSIGDENAEESLWFRFYGSPMVTDADTLDHDLRGKFASVGTTARQNYELLMEQMTDAVDEETSGEIGIYFS